MRERNHTHRDDDNDELPDGHSPDALSRRTFLRYGAVAGTVAATGRPLPGHPADRAQESLPTGPAAPAPPSFELEEATIAQLQGGMRTGEYTSRSITGLYLDRIAALDPKVASVIETNPDALEIADRLDAERKEGRVRGPLHGIPVLVKDNLDTADRMHTTAGSYALLDARPVRDSFVVQRLRDAGAVILGKANLSEWANFRSSRSSSGWSGRGGQCRNPYALDRSPNGSSAGTGAAVSASFVAVGVGTETDGSIVCPSSANGVVGIKPTLGLVSRAGIVPIAHSQDTAGPMARTVTDAAILLSAMAGIDPRDPATAASEGHGRTDYTRVLDPDGLRGARIGVARRRYFGQSPDVDRIIEEAIEVMRDQGAVIVDPADIPHAGQYRNERTVLLYEFKHDIREYLAGLGPDAPVHTLADLIRFNEQNRTLEMPYFGQETFEAAEEMGPLTEQEYLDGLAENHRLSREDGIDQVMGEHRLDAIVAPTTGPAWTLDLVNGDHYGVFSAGPAAVSGYASLSMPAGYAWGLPVGISFVGGPWSEPTLLRLAYALEQALPPRRPPRFLETADLTVR